MLRRPSPRIILRGSILAGATAGLLVGCFSTDSLEGLPCSSDASCGPDRTCAFGYCRAEGFDAQALCGDGLQEQGEFCYSSEDTMQVPVVGVLKDVVWADFDGNGFIDALTVSDIITVNLNNGDGTYSEGDYEFILPIEDIRSEEFPFDGVPDGFEVRVIPLHVAVGDFAGDPLPDLILAVEPAADNLPEGPATEAIFGSLWLAENLGEGDVAVRPMLETAEIGELTVLPTGLRSGDFDGDGKADVIAVTLGDDDAIMGEQLTYVMLMEEGGELGEPELVPQGGRGLPTIGDLNGDGIDDLATPDAMMNTVSIVLGPMGGETLAMPPERFTTDAPVSVLREADVDGDGDMDIVVGYGDEGLQIWQGDASGLFEAGSRVTDNTVDDLVIEDFDGDGSLDILSGSSSGLYIHPGYGDGSYGGGFLLDEAVVSLLSVIQIDGDGVPDLVVGSPNLISLFFSRP